MKSLFLLTFALAVFAVSPASATVTLRFGTTGVRATGFSNHLGVDGVNGMRWGVVISTTNAGFSGGSYDIFDNSVSQFLTVGGLATDDYYYIQAAPVNTQFLGVSGSDPGGNGAITSATGAPNGTDGIIPGVTTNDPFAIMWFESTPAAASYYGLMSDASFLLPGTSGTVDFFAPFTGGTADPIKAANLQFPGAGPVPEPSRMMLLGFGLVGLFFRRRR